VYLKHVAFGILIYFGYALNCYTFANTYTISENCTLNEILFLLTLERLKTPQLNREELTEVNNK